MDFRENNKKLLLVAISIIILAAVLIMAFYFPAIKKPFQPLEPLPPKQPSPTGNLQIPQGPIFGINAIILKIEDIDEDQTLLVLRSDQKQEYRAAITKNTPIFRLSRVLTETAVKSTQESAGREDLEVGIRLYLQSKIDLLSTADLSAQDIKSIDIYVE